MLHPDLISPRASRALAARLTAHIVYGPPARLARQDKAIYRHRCESMLARVLVCQPRLRRTYFDLDHVTPPLI
jgi:hypothetical protein